MAKLQTDADLTPYNTLRVPARAKYFLTIRRPADLVDLPPSPWLVLGQGANILFTKNYPGTVIKNVTSGFKVLSQTTSDVLVEAASGQNWHDLVTWAVDQGWSGIENMALIPGTVGAALAGDIAAYGQNFQDVFVCANVVDLTTHRTQTFDKPTCQLGYRDSFFKHHPGDYFIASVRLRLSKTGPTTTQYYDRHITLKSELARLATPPYTPKDIYRVVSRIRAAKLPNWKKVGTAGSFFKNPVVHRDKLRALQEQVPQLQFYPVDRLSYPRPTDPAFSHADFVLVAAGRLLDFLGWKGKTMGRVSTSPNQALYVINLGGATGEEIYAYALAMQADVQRHFGITLDPEVVII